MASSREGSPRRAGIIVHDPEVARAQSALRPRGSKGRDRGGHQQQSCYETESVGLVA